MQGRALGEGARPAPGHGSFSRSFVVWAVLVDESATPEPKYKLQGPNYPAQAYCATVSGCVAVEEPNVEDVEISNMLAGGCDSLTVDDLKALGFVDDLPNFFIVDHICTTTNQLFTTENEWGFGAIEHGKHLDACIDDPQTENVVENAAKFNGECTSTDCPVGGGEDGSTGTADSTGAVDSTGAQGASEFDCSPFDGLSYSNQRVENRSRVLRDVVVRRPLADLLLEQPFEALYFCGQALVNNAMRIHTVKASSPLRDLGLAPDDTIKRVCSNGICSTVPTGMYDRMAGPLEHGGDIEIHLSRGPIQLEYTLQVREPQ